ncbi:hypothetical protein GGR53DRAFT_484672 [Hypoxylon sp. FL1150]|nr:hypothetical protein GGR53DRAFT_484672 [Hypoxylon sp. FL1150]
MDIMDEDNITIPLWRRTHLGEEPIYCAAPPPSNQDDIICFGSDEELDESAKIAKRLRYEAKALDYLEGRPVQILSASLRGPFDKASGWKNPWLPKPSATKEPIPKPSRLSNRPGPAIKQRVLRRSHRLAQQDSTTTDTDTSMQYHLPSISSNREAEATGAPLETEKLVQIQAWAKSVSLGTLAKDPFWVPDQAPHEENTEIDKKRPVGKDWLKGKQSKRKRIDNSQTTTAASTPMPALRAQAPTRSRSVPTSIGHVKQPIPPSKAASRSFELPTPSSTINQNTSEITHAGVDETSTGHGNTSSQDELSNASGLLQTEDIMTGDTCEQPLPTDQPGYEHGSDPKTSSSLEQTPRDAINQDQQKQENETGLESYLDESFHYRARPEKKATPIPDPDFPTMATCPLLAQTGTPESQSHADAVAPTVAEVMDQSPEKVYNNQQIDVDESKRNETIDPTAPADRESSEHSVKSDNASATSKTSSTPSTKDGVVVTNVLDPIQDDLAVQPAVVETKDSENNTSLTMHTTNEAHIVQSKPLVEEQSALVDDPVAGRKESVEASELPTTGRTLSSLMTKAVPEPEPHDTVQHYKTTVEDGSESDTDSIIIPLSQVEWGFAEGICSTPKKPKAVTEDEIETSVPELHDGLEKGNPPQLTLLGTPEIVTRRSPWVSDLPPGSDLTAEHIKSEPIDEPLFHSYQSIILTSQTSNGETPRLGPSQQSPWAGESLEPVRSGGQGQCSPTPAGTIHAGAGLTTAAMDEPQSPWNVENIGIVLYPNYRPISSTPVARAGGLLHSSSRLSTMAPEPIQQSSGYQWSSPATPPRASSARVRTPEFENSILPFAMFNTPSPKRQRRRRRLSGRYSHTSQTRSILSSAKHSNPWNSSRSNRRVSFAPLPTEDDNNSILSATASSVPTRAASPPPQTMADVEDEDVSGRFQSHFDVMKLRASGENVQLQQQPQLLPSFSQQKPSSPPFNAMAAAFQEADAYMIRGQEDLTGALEESMEIDQQKDNAPQSPWRKESQGVDDVAAVMNNLDEFIGAWDVEAELKQEPVGGSQSWGILG